ncbi:MAG: type II toxin-antitoxin system RelE family toxin [Bdellovibrionota bacterium]
MASYKITLKRSAEKELRKIDKAQIPKIIDSLSALGHDPRPAQSRKLVGSQITYRLRVGHYRIIYLVFDETKEIEVQRIRHRKEAYT